jgi:hypothetical protein
MLEMASKHCFFEKKQFFAPTQRGCGAGVAHTHGQSKTKFFCYFLFTKSSAFPFESFS